MNLTKNNMIKKMEINETKVIKEVYGVDIEVDLLKIKKIDEKTIEVIVNDGKKEGIFKLETGDSIDFVDNCKEVYVLKYINNFIFNNLYLYKKGGLSNVSI